MELSAYTRYAQFLSHPDNKLLIDHLIKVANKAKEISSQTDLNCEDEAYYAGLLHDIGKINPYYQEIFHADAEKRKSVEETVLQKYEQSHSPFSAWAALKLLGEKIGLDEKSIDMTIHAIYGHHSNLKNILPEQDNKTEKYKNSQMAISYYLKHFVESTRCHDEFSLLDWESCLSQFQRPVEFKSKLESDDKNCLFDFLRSSCIFSALLQADRGSFNEWNTPSFEISFDTDKLVAQSKTKESKLAYLRDVFQKHALENHDTTSGVLALEAPTGIGKTKIFLDLISRYKHDNKLERVYYFSPLLALTEDFEKKIFGIVKNQEKILVYSHLFSGSLEEKRKQETGVSAAHAWDFENESFNKEFIITTTQRLLITLFSNRQSDKLKLLSLKNSLLIIDEVQTIPKLILPTLVGLFEQIAFYLHSKILLVSATIPYELKDIKKLSIQKEVKREYLQQTFKRISFLEPFEIPNKLTGRSLFMSNTRKKNLAMYEKINKKFGQSDIIYMSSGISKIHRLERLKNVKPDSIVVSTQVIEAGVDVSFDQMYREAAPLDNIIQAMGRLNREAEKDNAVMTVFKDTKDDWKPYSKLEWQESLRVIRKVRSSTDLYDELPSYYQKIWEENKTNEESAKKLARLITRLDYEEVWKFIKEKVLPDDDQETVFIPENQAQWNQIKNTFLSDLERKRFRKFVTLTANLPKSPENLGIEKFFDAELYEKSILLPKWEHLNEVYDKVVGLDKWAKDVVEK
ncbi:MAG: CRISPR-associated helicase Cas3' [Thaumarchaeota archaeon]|nr:CRISPR-associated helicase Cas3' [Nitrososphaerota archaeon]